MTRTITNLASKLANALGKEEHVLQELHEDVKATIKRMSAEDPGLEHLLEAAHGYAVFPSVGKATAVLGGAYGKGEVFQRGKLIGYAAIMQLTLGVQVGGQTFAQIIAFESPQALARFKAGKTAFAANASAVLVKAGAAASAGYERGAAVFVSPDGGMMLEAAIGAQKFIYRPAALGRTKHAPQPGKTTATNKSPKARASATRRKTPTRHGKAAEHIKSSNRRPGAGSGS